MDDMLRTVDFESTVRDYEFTRMARRQIHEVVTSDSFQDMSPEDIFRFLFREMQLVSFKDYLKRYLYERAGIREPFRQIDDRTWQDVIAGAFEENQTPFSLKPTSTRKSVIIKGWLTSDRVQRGTVLLLGFGLRMQEGDVSDFLTKVLREDDFRADDPFEMICRYCCRRGLPYARARQLQTQFEQLPAAPASSGSAEEALADESTLLRYLAGLKTGGSQTAHQQAAFGQFQGLYRRCVQCIAEIYNQDEEEKPRAARRTWQAEDVSCADLEKMLCSGIPLTESGNLTRASLSLLNRHFQSFRPSRQHLEGVLKGDLLPDRYDLITLSFFLAAQQDVPGEERLRQYLQDANDCLAACGMGGLYPANPYEAFILICVLSDCPLAVYGDIWELSYADQA